jgi:uncharacterized protein
MSRPLCCRRVRGTPAALAFEPKGSPSAEPGEVALRLDEFEAIRLADLGGLYHQQAAERMGVSRATFGRILESAHRKVAEFLIRGKALRIEGRPPAAAGPRATTCPHCHLKHADSPGKPGNCPRCERRTREGIQLTEEKP